MIEFQNISKTYATGVLAIDGLSLKIERGEFVVLIGASGSGKSTMLKMINRMESHDAGKILFDGREIYSFKVRELRLRMGYAIQSVGLFPHWTVARNISVVPRMLGWPAQQISERVSALLQLFDLDPAIYRTRFPHQLSGGQQQRVGVARALAADPAVLLMDEPFGALDPLIRASLQLEMKRVHRSSGKTIVMVTHDVDEALRLATRIVLLDQGRVVQTGTPLELLTQPASSLVVDFVGRSDIGIKLLSLQSAQNLARAEAPLAGASLPAETTLREAVSFLAMHRLAAVNLVSDSGVHGGVLHVADIFSPPADQPADRHG
ncbi:osmoprotectant transport system ATP-binding protein [Polaromonas sp. OV174]|uniref:ABC transporter ATP-binding protein n=1 Tax=Polaromonas sp. OV174 TaxID=1855300 RepID=UPI0008E42B78|nr:ABC transporter ATP-binding protein [Polaromonas sp. OV174]SFB78479.1 osmoprotectant transport system ATP-binding protein [Polaromonas sp. OV174]